MSAIDKMADAAMASRDALLAERATLVRERDELQAKCAALEADRARAEEEMSRGIDEIATRAKSSIALRARLERARELLVRVPKYCREDEVVSPRATRLPRLCAEIDAFLAEKP